MRENLTEDERKTWRSWVIASRQLSDRFSRALRTSHGLTLVDFEILSYLAEADENRMRMNELAVLIVSSRSRLSHLIDRLEQNGLVTREDCNTDGRGLFAVLTKQGRLTIDAASHDAANHLRENFFIFISRRELEIIARTCAKIIRMH